VPGDLQARIDALAERAKREFFENSTCDAYLLMQACYRASEKLRLAAGVSHEMFARSQWEQHRAEALAIIEEAERP
jgi:hypothetical protein